MKGRFQYQARLVGPPFKAMEKHAKPAKKRPYQANEENQNSARRLAHSVEFICFWFHMVSIAIAAFFEENYRAIVRWLALSSGALLSSGGYCLVSSVLS